MLLTALLAGPLLAPVTLVGLLTEQGDRVCQKGEERWVNPRFEVGFSPITLAEHLSPPAPDWIGRPVVVQGEVTPSPRGAPVVDDATCPPMQMRSDWILSKGGIRLARGGTPPSAHYRVTSLAPFEGLQVRVEGDKALISFKNTLPVALEGVALRAHYEGCYGKPGTREVERPVGALAAGASHAAEVPALADERHVIASVQVVTTGGALFDLDVVVPADQRPSCEGRRRR